MLGADPVQVVAGEVPVVSHDRVVKAPRSDGFVGRQGGRSLPQNVHHVVNGPAVWVADLGGSELHAGGDGVHVGLDKAGQHRGPVEVDDLGARTDQSVDVGSTAHGDDSPLPGGQRFGGRGCRVQGPEGSVGE